MVRMNKRGRLSQNYHYQETISDGETGEDVKIPAFPNGNPVTCTIIAGANMGKFQITTSSDDKVLSSTANWQDWELGTITGTVTDVLIGSACGIRGVSVSGEIHIEIVV